MDQAYSKWANQFYVYHPNCGIILLALPYLPIQARKVMLAFTRIRQPVSMRTRFQRTFKDELSKYHAIRLDRTRAEYSLLSLHDLLSGMEEYISDPITMGFLSTAIRSAPYVDYTSVQEVKDKSIFTELQAAIRPSSNAELDYRALFDLDRKARNVRLFPNLPLDPLVHAQLHSAFMQSKKTLEGHIFFPAMSEKTIGDDARETASWGCELGIDQLYSMGEIKSTADVERFYHLWGVELHGIVEVRSAWRYNILKPRVYYAQGPDCYHASKYIQEVFNIILDHFEVVHRYNRYERPIDQINSPSDRLAIYDYSSFTSSLDEVKRFTCALASFYQDIQVVLVDSYSGPITANLGQMLLHYNDVCNLSADFDVTKVLDLEDRLFLRHTTGMLGIPGNISSCTLLHGIHLIVAIGGIYLGRCVGDDALAILRNGSASDVWDMFISAVNNLGTIADEKFEYWDDEDDPETEGGAYCKRPIARLHGAILQEPAIVWPGIHDLIPLRDAYHIALPTTRSKVIKTFIAQWSRLLTRIETYNLAIPEKTRDLLHTFQDWGYRKCNLRKGGVQLIRDIGFKVIAPARMTRDEFGTGWKQITINFIQQTAESHEFPRWAGLDDPIGFTAGEMFCHKSTRLLGILEKLGYLEKQIARDAIDLRSLRCQEYLERLVTLSYPFCYEWVVKVDCPKWAEVVSILELMSPHERLSNLLHGKSY